MAYSLYFFSSLPVKQVFQLTYGFSEQRDRIIAGAIEACKPYNFTTTTAANCFLPLTDEGEFCLGDQDGEPEDEMHIASCAKDEAASDALNCLGNFVKDFCNNDGDSLKEGLMVTGVVVLILCVCACILGYKYQKSRRESQFDMEMERANRRGRIFTRKQKTPTNEKTSLLPDQEPPVFQS